MKKKMDSFYIYVLLGVLALVGIMFYFSRSKKSETPQLLVQDPELEQTLDELSQAVDKDLVRRRRKSSILSSQTEYDIQVIIGYKGVQEVIGIPIDTGTLDNYSNTNKVDIIFRPEYTTERLYVSVIDDDSSSTSKRKIPFEFTNSTSETKRIYSFKNNQIIDSIYPGGRLLLSYDVQYDYFTIMLNQRKIESG